MPERFSFFSAVRTLLNKTTVDDDYSDDSGVKMVELDEKEDAFDAEGNLKPGACIEPAIKQVKKRQGFKVTMRH